jgi:hypothetical protein
MHPARRRGLASCRRGPYDAPMYEEEQDQTPEEIPADTVGAEDAPQPGTDDEPGAADYVKAAVKGAKNLKDLKNLEP